MRAGHERPCLIRALTRDASDELSWASHEGGVRVVPSRRSAHCVQRLRRSSDHGPEMRVLIFVPALDLAVCRDNLYKWDAWLLLKFVRWA